jgi:hypothetical protein
MKIIKPRFILCILHDEPNIIEELCHCSDTFTYDKEYSNCGFDENMYDAFDASWDRVSPSAADTDRLLVKEHKNVSYVLSKPLEKENSKEISFKALTFIAKAFVEGARAVKCESSGIAHGKSK